jgi:metal-sulfur cluster biosynthetic enzyme
MAIGPLSITTLLAAGGSNEVDQLREMLHDVIDPELGVDIVSLGLLYDLRLQDRVADVLITTTTPACPLGAYISDEIERVLMTSGAVDQVTVETTHSPPWTPQMMTQSTKQAFGWT